LQHIAITGYITGYKKKEAADDRDIPKTSHPKLSQPPQEARRRAL
jgi:hypothetical protein